MSRSPVLPAAESPDPPAGRASPHSGRPGQPSSHRLRSRLKLFAALRTSPRHGTDIATAPSTQSVMAHPPLLRQLSLVRHEPEKAAPTTRDLFIACPRQILAGRQI